MIPVLVGGFNIIELFLTAISYSLYAFEYKWMNMGKWGGQSALRLCVCVSVVRTAVLTQDCLLVCLYVCTECNSVDTRLSACVFVCLF